jgi:hypothetical protein
MDQRKIILIVLLAAAIIYMFVSCGGTGTATDGDDDAISSAPAFESIGDLPTSTAKVVSAETASSLSALIKETATTGLPFGTTTSSSFTDGTSSIAMCETFNEAKWVLNQAAQGDTIMCYIQTVMEAIAADTSHELNGVDIYDGDAHIFALTGDEDEFEAPDLIKMQFETNDSGYITSFTMYACSDDEQEMYLNQTIDPSTGEFSMTNIGTHGDSEWSGSESASVTGYVNNLGYFEGTKNLTMDFTGEGSGENDGDTNSGHMVFTQTETGGTLSGVMTGTYNSEDDTYTNKAYAAYQIVDGNSGSDYSLGLLALGDGAAQYSFVGESAEYGDWTDSGTESWNGDTTAVETSNDYTETAEDGTLLSTSSISTPSFGSHAIDCTSLTAEGTINFTTLGIDPEGSCDQLSHDHINCWEVLGENDS